MLRNFKLLNLIAFCVMAAACSDSAPPASSEASAPAKRVETVIDPQIQALEKAKTVEALQAEADRKRAEAAGIDGSH